VTEFKMLGDLLTPDPRMPGDLPARHEDMASLGLPEYVPADIREYFDTTRLLWVYGHFAYPFFGWADLHARIAVERALRRRLGKDQVRTGLGALLKEAIARALLTDEGLAGFHETIDVQLEQKQIEAEVREMTACLGVSPEEQEEFKSFVHTLVDPFAKARHVGAHEGAALHDTPKDTKETIKLARAIIIRLFPKGSPNDVSTQRGRMPRSRARRR
jgi:hypothetical protein